MGFLVYIIFGGIVGWVASLLMKTDAEQGILLNVIVGIVGSVFGSWLAGQFGFGGVNGFNLSSFVVALIGAVIFIAAVKTLRH